MGADTPHLLQLAKAQQVVAAVPAALARIRSSHSNLGQIPPLSEGGGTPFRTRPPSPEDNQSMDEILQKLSPEYRADVARMLIRSASKALPDSRRGYAPFNRKAQHCELICLCMCLALVAAGLSKLPLVTCGTWQRAPCALLVIDRQMLSGYHAIAENEP